MYASENRKEFNLLMVPLNMVVDTSVKDVVVLVVDKMHQRHGDSGKMIYHRWGGDGMIGVRFADGSEGEFYDGTEPGDSACKIRRFYRHSNDIGKMFDTTGSGPATFQREFVEHGGTLETLAQQYRALFNEDLPKINPEAS